MNTGTQHISNKNPGANIDVLIQNKSESDILFRLLKALGYFVLKNSKSGEIVISIAPPDIDGEPWEYC